MWPFKRKHVCIPILTTAQSEHLLRIGEALADSPKKEWGQKGGYELAEWQQCAILALTCRDVGWFATWRLNQYAAGYAMQTGTAEGEVLPILSYDPALELKGV